MTGTRFFPVSTWAGVMFCEGVRTHEHVRQTQDSSVWRGPSSLGRPLLTPTVPPESPSACPLQGRTPALLIGTSSIEAFIMGLHVAQTGIVVGVNKGEMNLKAEKTGAYVRGGSWEEAACLG